MRRADSLQFEPFVEYVGVQKTFDGETLVVKNLDLALRKGEFLTLLGPSGSGKTTSLMMLAGFEAPTRGDIRLLGRSIRNLPPHQRDIGMVFQSYALFPHMTVAENVGFPLRARRRPKTEIAERVGCALDMVRLTGFGDRRPGELSGGQQQRVALARALVFEPKLVLMDEPLGALDKQLREHMQIEIKHLHARLGVTIVYVTHDQSEALTMSDRIAVFNNGEVEQLAPPRTLYEEPQNAFVAGFIGENNKVRGTVFELCEGRCSVRTESGHRILATPVDIRQAGVTTLLSIRPESVVIGPAAAQCENRLECQVTELIYQGDHIRVAASYGRAETFMIKVPRAHANWSIDTGSAISIGWNARDCRAFAIT